MSSERRKDPRIPCRIPCEVLLRGSSERSTVHDVSRGGLGVQGAKQTLAQGDSCLLRLRPAGRPTIEIQTMVWHSRPVRKGGNASVWGLVLTEPSDEFFNLVEHLAREASTVRTTAAGPTKKGLTSRPKPAFVPAPTTTQEEPPAGGEMAPAPGLSSIRQYAVRVTQKTGSRTCRLIVSAKSHQLAGETALDEVGDDWTVLEVTAI